MTIQTLVLDPNAQSYTDDEIVGKVNSATAQITRSNSVSGTARPIADNEVTETKINTGAVSSGKLASGVAKDNLDAMADTARGYIKTSPTSGQCKVIAMQKQADGKVSVTFDDVPV